MKLLGESMVWYALMGIAAIAITGFFLALFYHPTNCSGCGGLTSSREASIPGLLLESASVARSKLTPDLQLDVGRRRVGVLDHVDWGSSESSVVVSLPLSPPMPCFVYMFDLRTADGLPVQYEPVFCSPSEFRVRLPAVRPARELAGGDLGMLFCGFQEGEDGYQVYTLELSTGASATATGVSLRSLNGTKQNQQLWPIAPGALPTVSAVTAEAEAQVWVSGNASCAAVCLDHSFQHVLFLPQGTAVPLGSGDAPLAMGPSGSLLVRTANNSAALVDAGGSSRALGPFPPSQDVSTTPFDRAGDSVLVGGELYVVSTQTRSNTQLPVEPSLPGVFENPIARCATFCENGDERLIVVLYEDQTGAWWKAVAYSAITLQRKYIVGADQRVASMYAAQPVVLRAQAVANLLWVTVEAASGHTLVLRAGSHSPFIAPPFQPGSPQRLVAGVFADTPLLVLDRDVASLTSFTGYYWSVLSVSG